MAQNGRPSAEQAREILRGVLRDMPDYVADLTDDEAIERAEAVLRSRAKVIPRGDWKWRTGLRRGRCFRSE